jgi:hypothetical protein
VLPDPPPPHREDPFRDYFAGVFVCAGEDGCDSLIRLYEIISIDSIHDVDLIAGKPSGTSNSVDDFFGRGLSMPEPRSDLLLLVALGALLVVRVRIR